MSKTPQDNPENDNGSDIPEIIDLGAADESFAQAAVTAQEHNKVRDERDKLLYAVAEAQNMRRRLQSEKEQAVQYANQTLIKALIPIIDNFERALAVDPGKSDAATVLTGLQIVHDQLMAELAKQSVEVIDPQKGDLFDPNRHQALMQRPEPGVAPNHVVQALTKGYAMHGRTLRPAGVIVAA